VNYPFEDDLYIRKLT